MHAEEEWGAESAALLSFSLLLVAAVVAAGRLHVGEEGRHAALDDHRETFQNQQNQQKKTTITKKSSKKLKFLFLLHLEPKQSERGREAELHILGGANKQPGSRDPAVARDIETYLLHLAA